ncbi:MAG: DM13 domain-containing protein, partial [Phormidesmis sp.]
TLRSKPGMIDDIAIQVVCCVNKTLDLNSFSVHFSPFSVRTIVNLGRLEKTDGAQRYAIPADVDIEALKSAVIWCRQFDVTFGYATF